MKKILLACAVTLAGLSASASGSMAATMINSKYCIDNSFDPVCMSAEMMDMRMKMMAMTKEKAMANRTNFCQNKANSSDPVCDPKMMNDTTGY